MLALSVSIMTRRSTPNPSPPVGGMPYSSAFRKSSSTSALAPWARFLEACASMRARWSTGSLSSEKALPISMPLMKYSNRSVMEGSSGLRLASGEISTG